MTTDHERQLEGQVDRALKSLPELKAPAALAPRVLATIAQRAAMAWYRQPWPVWPRAVQMTSLAILLGVFGAFVVAAWQLTQAAGYHAAWDEVGQLFSGFSPVL